MDATHPNATHIAAIADAVVAGQKAYWPPMSEKEWREEWERWAEQAELFLGAPGIDHVVTRRGRTDSGHPCCFIDVIYRTGPPRELVAFTAKM